jgi:hypothetical protein
MTSEEERLARLRRTLHSLATRVPKIILKRVESTFPVLKKKAVSVMHYITKLYQKHLYHWISFCRNFGGIFELLMSMETILPLHSLN